jgi:hypothetical protein
LRRIVTAAVPMLEAQHLLLQDQISRTNQMSRGTQCRSQRSFALMILDLASTQAKFQ